MKPCNKASVTNVLSNKMSLRTESIKVKSDVEWCPSRFSDITLGNRHGLDLSRSGLVVVKNATLNLFSLDTDSRMGAPRDNHDPHRSNAMMIVREICTTSGGAKQRKSLFRVVISMRRKKER